jgi:hypothetical protein
VSVTSLRDTMAFWRGVLHPLGYGRINEWPGCVLWARDGAQLLVQEQPYPSSGIVIMLRAPARAVVDAIHATAVAQGWPVKEPPGPQYIAPGYMAAPSQSRAPSGSRSPSRMRGTTCRSEPMPPRSAWPAPTRMCPSAAICSSPRLRRQMRRSRRLSSS